MDSSPDLSVKLRRGSSDSRDSFYMGFAQGIDSDIEEVTTVQNVPPPPPPQFPAPEEPPIDLPAPVAVSPVPEELPRLPETEEIEEECENVVGLEGEQRENDDPGLESEEAPPESSQPEESALSVEPELIFDMIPPPPLLPDEDDDTNTSVTVIHSKNKTPSSSSSSISSALNELAVDESANTFQPVKSPPKSRQQSVEAEIASTSPPSYKSPSLHKSASFPKSPTSSVKSPSGSHKSPPVSHKSPPSTKASPPRKLHFHHREPRGKNCDSDSIDSINAIDCKIDDDNRDDSSPTDSMPPAPTPPPLGFPLSLEKSGIMEATSQVLVPSPSSPDNAIVSPETLSHHSSPAKSSRVLHYATHVTTIDETRLPSSLRSSRQQLLQQSQRSTPSSPPPPFNSGPLTPAMSVLSNNSLDNVDSSQALVPHHSTAFKIATPTSNSDDSPPPTGGSTTQHLSVLYETHHHLHPILTSPRRQSKLPDTSRFLHQQSLGYSPAQNEISAFDAFCSTLSALYGKILVVMGIAFPMAEVISTYIPVSFYEGFYLYLYCGSMLFLFFMYATLLWGHGSTAPVTTSTARKSVPTMRAKNSSSSDSGDQSDHESTETSRQSERKSSKTIVAMRRPSIMAASLKSQHYGSFYLRMGAVAFGIGSMIYSGLEFGQYFELERDTKCHNVLLALTPATRMAFIFIQMYFIFLNNEQIKVYRHKILARFGLMHMIGTNLSVWFSVLIQETKHEILTFYDPENRTLKISHRLGNKAVHTALEEVHSRVARGLKGPHNIFECRRSNILGTLVQDASPFLFPCTIEYSLICAAILYVMWRNISRPEHEQNEVRSQLHPYKRSPHHYSVDCAGAHKGLFIGILMLVLTIISLILFFVLISKPEFTNFAVTEVNICELVLYGTTTIATILGMIQVRTLHYDSARNFSLDDILLVGGQTGSFLYSTFTIIGAHLTLKKNTILILITAMASLVETAFQTMFILDASRRSAATPDHIRKKPGRELVTFLLVSNLAMWAINTLEKSRAESHPLQLNFYGLWAWTIITHVSMPLAIFYRFHSTVCLCDIWKRAWKMKPAYM